MAHIVVEESFDPPISEEVHNHLVEPLKPCLDLREATWLGSHMAKEWVAEAWLPPST